AGRALRRRRSGLGRQFLVSLTRSPQHQGAPSMKAIIAAVTMAVVAIAWPVAGVTQPRALRAGAAKVDVTPETLPGNYEGVLDPLYARAIVVADGTTSAALISIDA